MKVRHKKRGTIYEIVGPAIFQTEKPISDDASVMVYRGEDGLLWVREITEFADGRFEKIES